MRRLFDRCDAGPGGGNLDDHVRSESAELHRLLDDRARVAKKSRVGLDRETAVAPAMRRKHGLEQLCRAD